MPWCHILPSRDADVTKRFAAIGNEALPRWCYLLICNAIHTSATTTYEADVPALLYMPLFMAICIQ